MERTEGIHHGPAAEHRDRRGLRFELVGDDRAGFHDRSRAGGEGVAHSARTTWRWFQPIPGGDRLAQALAERRWPAILAADLFRYRLFPRQLGTVLPGCGYRDH